MGIFMCARRLAISAPLLTHLGLRAELPKFKPAPPAALYEHACGPPDEACQPDLKGDLYEVIEPTPADD